jgi:hypothetical protein
MKPTKPPNDKDQPTEELLPNTAQVSAYIVQNYPEVKEATNIAIGKLGKVLHIVVRDSQQVWHTFHVPPQEVFKFLNKQKEATRTSKDIQRAKELSAEAKAGKRQKTQSKQRDKDTGRER